MQKSFLTARGRSLLKVNSETSFDYKKMRYLNVGGGNFDHRDDGWLNLDYPFEAMAHKRDFSKIDIVHNLMDGKPFPVPNDTFHCVYSEHTLEHLPFPMVVFTVLEVKRILKPGGVFRIAVPDADKFWEVLVDQQREPNEVWSVKGAELSREQLFLDATLTPLRGVMSDEMLRHTIEGCTVDEALLRLESILKMISVEEQAKKPGAHCSWWNADRLKNMLIASEFDFVTGPLEKNQSRHKIFKRPYIDRTAHICTVRVEASKPL
jgi:SAM-dependent methyltransferase